MPLTTTAVNACDVVIKLDDDAGVLVDISGSSNKVGFSFPASIAEFFTFGSHWPGRLCCSLDAPLSLEIVYSEAADEAWDILKQWHFTSAFRCLPRTIEVFIPDETAGSDKFAGEYLLEELSWDAEAGSAAAIIVTVSLQPTGEVELTSVAT